MACSFETSPPTSSVRARRRWAARAGGRVPGWRGGCGGLAQGRQVFEPVKPALGPVRDLARQCRARQTRRAAGWRCWSPCRAPGRAWWPTPAGRRPGCRSRRRRANRGAGRRRRCARRTSGVRAVPTAPTRPRLLRPPRRENVRSMPRGPTASRRQAPGPRSAAGRAGRSPRGAAQYTARAARIGGRSPPAIEPGMDPEGRADQWRMRAADALQIVRRPRRSPSRCVGSGAANHR